MRFNSDLLKLSHIVKYIQEHFVEFTPSRVHFSAVIHFSPVTIFKLLNKVILSFLYNYMNCLVISCQTQEALCSALVTTNIDVR